MSKPTQWADPKYSDTETGPHEMRHAAADYLRRCGAPGADILQFGVWVGHSMVAIPKIWARHGLLIRHTAGPKYS